MALSWLTEFLSTRGLRHPDRRMLYAYDLTDREFVTLEQVLQSQMRATPFARALAMNAHLPALFVLYAAEWWKRTYDGGAWGWHPILARLTDRLDHISPNDRSECVVDGLRYWGHRPLKDGMRFLGAIVSHGGLPMRLLAHGAGSLHAALVQVVRFADRYRWDRQQILDAVRDRQLALPAAYRRDEITDLLAQIAQAVVELKVRHGLASTDNPIAHLDANAPGWRTLFPISLENDTARALLQGLVVEAASQQLASGASDLFACERQLVQRGDAEGYVLTSTVTYPSRTAAAALAHFFDLREDEALPRAFAVDFETAERMRFVDGRAVLGSSDDGVALSGRRIVLTDERVALEHRLVLRTPKGDLGVAATVLGGAALPADEPWVFACTDESSARYVGSGSVKLPDRRALVAVGPDWHVEADADAPAPRTIEQRDLAGSRRTLVQLDGDAVLTRGSVSYRVRLGQTREAKSMFQWVGRRLPEAGAALVFRGRKPPALCELAEDGRLVSVASADQQWRVPGRPEPVDPRSARGPVDVLVVRHGETVARQRIWVLSPDAAIAYESDRAPGHGSVVLGGWGGARVALEWPEGIDCDISGDEACGQVRVRMQAEGTPPAAIRLLLAWPGSTRQLRLTVPFPVTGGRFLGADGRVIAEGAHLLLGDLIGARLQIFDSNPNAPKRYRIELALSGVSQAAPAERAVSLDATGRAELRLIDLRESIESLLSMTEDLDRAVTVTLRAGNTRVASIGVRRYSVKLQYGADHVALPAEASMRLDPSVLERIDVLARPLSFQADDGASRLTRTEPRKDGSLAWHTASLDPDCSPWLVYPASESSVMFRPMLWTSQPSPEDGSAHVAPARCALGEAMLVASAPQRIDAIEAVLDRMVADFDHPSWALLGHLWSSLGHLPLSTLDVWCVVGKRPRAAIGFLFRGALDATALPRAARRLRDEVGWIPELVGLADWHAATASLWSWWKASIPAELATTLQPREVFMRELEWRAAALKTEMPSIEATLDFVQFELSNRALGRAAQIARGTNASANEVLRRMYRGVDSLLNAELMLEKADDEHWPATRFCEHAVTALVEACPPVVRGRLNKHLSTLFGRTELNDHMASVVNAPMLCALWALTDTDRHWWGSPVNRIMLRQIRDFAPAWFERAYAESCVALLSLDGVVAPVCFIDFNN